MSGELHSLEQRIAELETRIAFQDQALTDLSDALAAARSEEAGNSLRMHRIIEELRQIRMSLAAQPFSADSADEPPPPHY